MPVDPLRVAAIVAAALALRTEEDRHAYLEEACAGDAALRRQIEEMILAQEAGHQGHQVAAGELMTEASAPSLPAARQGTQLGPYKLLQKLGEGGMGEVWMAEQEEPVRRKVALKIIKLGMDTREVIARFESERQALAMMDHPNIAKVLDAGTTASGRPFFVMELVKGVPITEFCDKNRLPAAERLKLFVTVCHAIQHAHHKGIIHRDIKPSNVFVTLHDGVPVVKVIDFGVAKATAQKLTERTLFTAYGQMVGTPAYMSPEQAEMSGLDIDTRSDIYSLGVLLYELLTGTTPLDARRLRTAGYAEIQRLIREEDAPRPSTRLSSLGGRATVMASNRGTDPKRLTQLLRSDLDWIVMKALEKDRNRRYDTPGNFAADIERYLRHDPIEARPPSTAYRMRKLLQRHKAAVGTTAAVAATLVLGIALSTWQAIRASRAERIAGEERDRALAAERQATTEKDNTREALDFIRTALVGQANPERLPDRELKLRSALDRAAQELRSRPPRSPLVEADIRFTFGEYYLALEENEQARQHLERALEIRRKELSPDHPDTAQAMALVAVAYFPDRRRVKESEALLLAALEIARRTRGEEHPDTLQIMHNLGWHYALLASPYYNVGQDEGRSAEKERIAQAEEYYSQVLQARQQVLGEKHPDTLRTMCNLAWALNHQRRFAEGAPLLDQALQLSRDALGVEHPVTLEAMHRVAWIHWQREGKLEQAESLHHKILASARKVFPEDSPFTMGVKRSLCGIYLDLEKYEEGEKLITEVLAWDQRRGSPPRLTAIATARLAYVRLKQQRWKEAEDLYRQVLATFGDERLDNWALHACQSGLGASLVGQGKYVEAEPLLLEAYRGLKLREEEEASWRFTYYIGQALERLVQLYEATGSQAEAARWQGELKRAKAAAESATERAPAKS